MKFRPPSHSVPRPSPNTLRQAFPLLPDELEYVPCICTRSCTSPSTASSRSGTALARRVAAIVAGAVCRCLQALCTAGGEKEIEEQ